MSTELVILEETTSDTQKKLRTWLSTGYKIEILNQNVVFISQEQPLILVTTLYRMK